MPEKADLSKVAPKMVRESDLLAVKGQIGKLKDELAKRDSRISQLESEVKITKANLDDDPEVKAVRQHLLDQAEGIAKREEEFQSKVASFQEREKESMIQSLATKYNLELDSIKDAENPKEKALELYTERLESEKNKTSEEAKEKSESSPAEQVFESAAVGGKVKKSPMEMSKEEFADFEKSLKNQAYAKAK